jgi:hypothetical protein
LDIFHVIKELEKLIKKIDSKYNGKQLVNDWKNMIRSLKLRKLDKLLS